MPNQDSMLIKAPSGSPFIVSTESDTNLESPFNGLRLLAFVAASHFALSAFGKLFSLDGVRQLS